MILRRDFANSRAAEFSDCETYRYRLRYELNDGNVLAPPTKPIAFVMLNPSTANELTPDPTVRRCMSFAAAWGYSTLLVANLFALRATDPRELARHADPIGPENDAVLAALMTDPGRGVHLPALGNDRGLNGVAAAPCVEWFRELQARLRRVRVACGDWRRVLGPSVLGKGKNVGGRRPCAVFLDPPYAHEFRDPYLYSEDDAAISAQVREWALEHGDDPDLRIALCGYEGEHEMPSTWTVHAWKAARGYAAEGNNNRERERIWFSPHCLPIEQQRGLFEETGS